MKLVLAWAAVTLCAWGCGNDTAEENNIEPEWSPGYVFLDADGQSNATFSGQVMRQVLVEDLKTYTASLDNQIDTGALVPAEGEVVGALDFYFRFDGDVAGEQESPFAGEFPAEQKTYNDISSGKNLVDKVAGNDAVTDYRDWNTEFSGWSAPEIAASGGSTQTPEGLLVAFFETIEANAIDRANGRQSTGPDGEPLPVYVTGSGQDLRQLTQKFLLGAVNFSQAADDYLDDDIEGKGLLSDNTALEEGRNYTTLGHAWDEAFGYFGASRHYDEFTLAEVAKEGGRPERMEGYWDADEDGLIDLNTEYNFGVSVNAAQRDLGATDPTDFAKASFTGFVQGRRFIAGLAGDPNSEELAQLKRYRDQVVEAWEGAYAATVVHYINQVIQELNAIGTPEYSFVRQAKVWSELKGFALSFQFNPRSPLNQEDFAMLHTLIGDRPKHSGDPTNEQTAYVADLKQARALLARSYGFSEDNTRNW